MPIFKKRPESLYTLGSLLFKLDPSHRRVTCLYNLVNSSYNILKSSIGRYDSYMSTGNYSKNSYRIYTVRCVYILNGILHTNKRTSNAHSIEEAVNETYEVHTWGKHPTFMCGVVSYRTIA